MQRHSYRAQIRVTVAPFLLAMFFISILFFSKNLWAVEISDTELSWVSSMHYSGCTGQDWNAIKNGGVCKESNGELCGNHDTGRCRQSCCALNRPGMGHGTWEYEADDGWILFSFTSVRRITSVSLSSYNSAGQTVYFGNGSGVSVGNQGGTATNPAPNTNVSTIKVTKWNSNNYWNINNVRFFCAPKTCADYPGDYGTSLADGCGSTIDCSAAMPLTEVMKVQCPGVTTPVRIAGKATSLSSLKIQKGGTTYSLALVDPATAPAAQVSCLRVKMPGVAAPQALRKCDPAVTATCN